MAFELANPEQVRQVEFRQRVENVVTEKQKGHPILFGFIRRGKFKNTIFAIDRETYESKKYENDQIDLSSCYLV